MNRFSVCRQTLQVQRDGFFDVALSFFECFALRVATGKCGDHRHIAAFGSLFIKDRVRKSQGALALHHFHCSGLLPSR